MGPGCGCQPSESRCRRWMPEVIPALRNAAITERGWPPGHGRAQRLAGGISTRAVDAEFRCVIELPQDSGARLFVVKRTSRSEMFKWIRSWLMSPAAESPAAKAPAPELGPTMTVPLATAVCGRLTHKRIYTFGATPSGQHCTKCPVCREPGHHVFSIALDEAGNKHRCCLRCLRRLGGEEQVQLAAKRSGNAQHVLRCIDALDELRSAFPDPSRRPYGEKALLAEIENPGMGYGQIEKVLRKLRMKKWTAYDLARIEGLPEPPSSDV